jgi:hypothetical protein
VVLLFAAVLHTGYGFSRAHFELCDFVFNQESKMETAVSVAERVGPAFSVDGMLQARAKTREAIRTIAALVRPGMVEEDAVDMAKRTLIASGLDLTWHPKRIRVGCALVATP